MVVSGIPNLVYSPGPGFWTYDLLDRTWTWAWQYLEKCDYCTSSVTSFPRSPQKSLKSLWSQLRTPPTAGHTDHLLGLLLLPWALGGGRLGCSLARGQLLGLDDLRGTHQVYHLLGLQLDLVRSDLKKKFWKVQWIIFVEYVISRLMASIRWTYQKVLC